MSFITHAVAILIGIAIGMTSFPFLLPLKCLACRIVGY